MSDIPSVESLILRRLRAASGWLFWLGLAMVVLGVAAIIFPIFFTLVAALLVGWVLLIFGVFALLGAFSIHGTSPFFGALLFGLLSLVVGIFMLFHPLAGAAVLTLVVGILFLLQGAFETFFAFEMRPGSGWVGMWFSGIASIVVAVLIAAGWPGISQIVLGLLLGINFISTGLSYIFVSRTLKPAA
jgi:uncharacterized membrane protein HdeD (DUF308 family)